jgi:tellurite resistance protein TerC
MDFSIIAIVIQLIFLEGILSIDNAAVLGAMVAPLPDNEPIPWPKRLAKIGKRFDHLLGDQRSAALKVGLLGAYFGRALMLLAASVIISNPWLKLVGAAYLIRLALDDLSAHGYHGEDEKMKPLKVRTFWMTVLSVELMDLAFSLDNVVAAVSLSDKIWVVMLGVAVGILVMRFAASIFSYVVEKEPILKTAAYILVLNIGIELLLEDLAHIEKVMTAELITVRPDQSVRECMRLLTENQIRHLPVIENGRVTGMISIGDVVRDLIEELEFLVDQLKGYITGLQ